MTMLSMGIGLVVALLLLVRLNRSLADTRVKNLLHSSTLAMEEDGRLALEKALEAFDLQPGPDTRSQLHQVLGVFRERTNFRGHTRPIWWMALCEKRNMLATASFDGSIKVWRLDGALLHSLEPEKPAPSGEPLSHYSVQFSRDGNSLLVASGRARIDGFAFLWDVQAEPRLVKTFPHDDCVVSAIFSGDEKQILTTAMDGTFSLRDRNGTLIWSRNLPERDPRYFLEAAVSPAGDKFLLRDLNPYDRTLVSAELWSLDGEQLQAFENTQVSAAQFSRDGKQLLTGHGTGKVRLWDVLEQGVKKVADLDRHTSRVQSIAFGPDGWILTAAKDRKVYLWTPDGRFQRQIGRHTSSLRSIHFSPDGRNIAVQVGREKIRIFDRTGNRIALLAGHHQAVNTILFSSDGNCVYTCSFDRTARKWELQETELPVYHGHLAGVNTIDCIHLSDNSLRLLSGSDDGHAVLWDEKGRLHRYPRTTEVSCMRFSPGGTEVLIGDAGGTLRLLDWASGDKLWMRQIKKDRIQWLTFLPDQRIIAAYRWYASYPHLWKWSRTGADLICSLGEKEKVWPCETFPYIHASKDNALLVLLEEAQKDNVVRFDLSREEPVVIEGRDPWGLEEATKKFAIWRAAVSPDGKTLVLGNRKGELLVLPRHGTPKRIQAHDRVVNSLDFSPDSSLLLSTSEDGTAQLRDRRGTRLVTYRGHDGAVNAGIFTPDGNRVLTASSDGTIRTWFVKLEEIEALARHRFEGVQ